MSAHKIAAATDPGATSAIALVIPKGSDSDAGGNGQGVTRLLSIFGSNFQPTAGTVTCRLTIDGCQNSQSQSSTPLYIYFPVTVNTPWTFPNGSLDLGIYLRNKGGGTNTITLAFLNVAGLGVSQLANNMTLFATYIWE